MKMARVLLRELGLKLRQVGVLSTLKLAAGRLFQRSQSSVPHPFDVEHGTDTSGIVEVGALDLPEQSLLHAVRYQTAIVEVFLELLNSLPIRHEDFVFIDLGSGKGRALLLASRLPFKEILGVELSASLHAIACRNIEIFRDDSQRCHRIRSICANVTDFELPRDPVVFYLFNPFDENVMRAVLAQIEDSLHQFPRAIYILYLKPVHRQLFDRSARFQVFKSTERYVIYESKSVARANHERA